MDYDFVALGDIVTDAFIRLKEAHIYTEENIEQLCLVNGAKIPFESVTVIPAVGNSPNASVAAARLGLRSALVTDMGTDAYGTECLRTLEREGVATTFVRRHEGKKSNYHYVLWFRDERTILIKHEEYPYAVPALGTPRWMYLSSLGQNSLPYQQAIAEYCAAHPDIKLAFQPGTFQIKLGVAALQQLYKVSELFFCNTDEARIILQSTQTHGGVLAKELSVLGPKLVVVTDGPRGAYLYDSRTKTAHFMPPYPDPKPPYERTGAGDAFASTFCAALALGKTPVEALRWAPINSMSVVQKIGAQAGLLHRDELERLLAEAPSNYQPVVQNI